MIKLLEGASGLERLIFARALIEDEERWTQGAEARIQGGPSCSPEDPNAVCWCARGALKLAGLPGNFLNWRTPKGIEHENDAYSCNSSRRLVFRVFDREIADHLTL